jgi:cytochrome c peroxidase
LRGRDLFVDKRCSACHELRAGVDEWQANNGLDAIPSDLGIRDPALRRGGFDGMFRAASLRNVAVTGPYMHDGRFVSLRDVIEHYDHGMQDSPHLDGILRDWPGTPLQLGLTAEDKDALEAFLRTMTDDEFLADPKFSDPFAP